MPEPAPREVLRTEHLTRHVGDAAIVSDVNISVYGGDILGIAGPSGAGKSSFLRLLNRLDEPSSGTCYIDDVDYRTIPPRELRRRVGMVMQTAYLFSGTVEDNIRFGPAQRGEVLPEARIAELLEEVGLAGFQNRAVYQLSGGEAQRVSLARTLANSPSLLLLDEPTSALDDVSKRGIEKLILEVVRAERLTCLIVTHDLAQAARLANRIMLMRAGQVERIAPAKEVLSVEGSV